MNEMTKIKNAVIGGLIGSALGIVVIPRAFPLLGAIGAVLGYLKKDE